MESWLVAFSSCPAFLIISQTNLLNADPVNHSLLTTQGLGLYSEYEKYLIFSFDMSLLSNNFFVEYKKMSAEDAVKTIVGVWKCDNSRTENFDEFLQEMGKFCKFTCEQRTLSLFSPACGFAAASIQSQILESTL